MISPFKPVQFGETLLRPTSGSLPWQPPSADMVRFSGKPSIALDPTPLQTLFRQFPPISLEEVRTRYAQEPEFFTALMEIQQLGYSKADFPQLRKLLSKPEGAYDMIKLTTVLQAALTNVNKPVPTIREQKQDTSWFYNETPLVEYLNIRALGENQSDGKPKRLGNMLDGIVYALQSRAGAFHLAPFHPSSFMDQLYCPKDMYSLDRHLIVPELTQGAMNPRSQMKLFIDVCHALREPVALFYDTLPHTGDLSVNYLDQPEAARWIALDRHVIENNTKRFDEASALIGANVPTNRKEFNSVYAKLCKQLHLPIETPILTELHQQEQLLNQLIQGEKIDAQLLEPELKQVLKQTFPGKSTAQIIENGKALLTDTSESVRQKLFELTLRKVAVLATHLAETDLDIVLLRENSEKVWRSGLEGDPIPSVEVDELIASKDSSKIAKQVRRFVKKELGKTRPRYEDIQASEAHYDQSLGKKLREQERIYNMPVGAWNGLIPELVGYHKQHHYPIFSCRGNSQTNYRYQNSSAFKDVAWKMFGTLSRRRLVQSDGQSNRAAIRDMENIVSFWLDNGFDGLRLDQTDHLYTAPYDFKPGPGKTLEGYLAEKEYAYDTMLPQTLNNLLNRLKKKSGKAMAVFVENMMYHPMEQCHRAFKEMKTLGADALIGNFQNASDLPSLVKRVALHNRIRQVKQAPEFLLSTVESHDNQLSGRDAGPPELKGIGSGPVSQAIDGISRVRYRFLLDAIGVPYVTSQAWNGMQSQKVKSSLIQETVVNPINLDFEVPPPTYTVGGKAYRFNDFKHNFADFIRRPEVKTILKGGQLFELDAPAGVSAVQVRNQGDESLLFVANLTDKPMQSVWVAGPMVGLNYAKPEAVQYPMDGTRNGKLEPVPVKLPFQDRFSLRFEQLEVGDIRVYRVRE